MILLSLVNSSASSYPSGCVMQKSLMPSFSARFIHPANEFGTACGSAFTCGAQVNTTFGFLTVLCSSMDDKSAKLCNGCLVALSRLISGTLQNSINLLNNVSL